MNHPHDRLFKATFSDPDVMTSFIEDLFPPDLAKAIDTNSLQLSNGSFIDDTLEEHFADLVYQCSLRDGSTLTIALLLEHKSYPVKHPHFQLMRYMLNHWLQNVEHNQSPMPIVPVIIYHGEGKWSAASLIEQMGRVPLYLHRFVPEFDYLFIDLSKMPDEQLLSLRSQFLSVSASLLKYSNKEKLKAFVMERFFIFLEPIETTDLEQFIQPIFHYIYEQSNLTGLEIVSIFSRVSFEKRHIAMTVYQQESSLFRREGLEIGIREGLKQGLEEGKEIGQEIGKEIGRKEVFKVAVKVLRKAGQTIPQIAAELGLSVSEVKAYLRAE